jgi:hypothetical protein
MSHDRDAATRYSQTLFIRQTKDHAHKSTSRYQAQENDRAAEAFEQREHVRRDIETYSQAIQALVAAGRRVDAHVDHLEFMLGAFEDLRERSLFRVVTKNNIQPEDHENNTYPEWDFNFQMLHTKGVI